MLAHPLLQTYIHLQVYNGTNNSPARLSPMPLMSVRAICLRREFITGFSWNFMKNSNQFEQGYIIKYRLYSVLQSTSHVTMELVLKLLNTQLVNALLGYNLYRGGIRSSPQTCKAGGQSLNVFHFIYLLYSNRLFTIGTVHKGGWSIIYWMYHYG